MCTYNKIKLIKNAKFFILKFFFFFSVHIYNNILKKGTLGLKSFQDLLVLQKN